jgi:dienelactone hydrolase
MKKMICAALISALLPLATAALALESPPVAPAASQNLPLYVSPPVGWEHPSQVELSEFWPPDNHLMLRNVSRPAVAVYLPSPGTATGTGVVIAPGGGFVALSIDQEGVEVAQWLARHGIAAFVLAYRLNQTPPDQKAFWAEAIKLFGKKFDPAVTVPGEAEATADARAAMALVRSKAATYGVNPDRLGFLGFSAGGMIANNLALDGVTKPAFVGSVYAPVRPGVVVPADAPPMFSAIAANDPLFADYALQSYIAWTAAKRPVELHVYAKGGHGFGMRKQGLTSDYWIDDFNAWLASLGLTRQAP